MIILTIVLMVLAYTISNLPNFGGTGVKDDMSSFKPPSSGKRIQNGSLPNYKTTDKGEYR